MATEPGNRAREMTTDSHGDQGNAEAVKPVIVELGKWKRKQVRQLLDGEGKLMTEVTDVIHELRSAGTINAAAQPVVIVVKQRSRSRGARGFGPFSF